MLSKLHSYHNLQMPSMSGRFFSKYSFQVSSLIIFFQKTNAGFQIEKCPENANFFFTTTSYFVQVTALLQ